MSKVDLLNNPVHQSPYAYLQAAGSDQSDGTAAGTHLRWDLLKSLGDHHLPKGNFSVTAPYNTTIAYNRANDFVRIFRSDYRPAPVIVKLKNAILPTTEINSGPVREWRYTGAGYSSDVTIRFADVTQYNAIRATMTTLKPEDFLRQYTGVVEVETPGRFMFAGDIIMDHKEKGASRPHELRIEVISQPDSSDTASRLISCRKRLTGNGENTYRTVCENIWQFRFDYNSGAPKELRLETYNDYIVAINNLGNDGKWEIVGDFSLTLTDSVAYLRLEDPLNYPIDKRWPKYNESDNISGAFKVKVNNYKDRWLPAVDPLNGLKEAVNQYLLLSKTDTQANASLQNSQFPTDQSKLDISYLDMLRLVALDFHVARMLGLGHIDRTKGEGGDKAEFVYCLQYFTQAPLENGQPSVFPLTHLYMTPPTTRQDYRLPPAPVLKPVTYGQTVDNGTGQPFPLSDAQGYALFDDLRFVNLHREDFNFEKPFGPFFYESTEYCICSESLPVQYGLEYRKDTEAGFRRPEILNDPSYLDFAALPETVGIPEQGIDPLFVHHEREEGIHAYGLYSINWFSRVSPVSPLVQTDLTDFPKRNTLPPPMNFAVQLIQEETPLIFTTQTEQNKLAALPPGDKTLVRATFDWNHFHNNAYQFGDKAELFFREAEHQSVRGEITSVTQLPNHQVQVTCTSYLILSTSPAQLIVPEIFPADVPRYTGGLFSAGDQQFLIANVIANVTGQNPVFILDQVRQTQSLDPSNTNTFITTETWLSPGVAERFMVLENTAEPAAWDFQLHKSIYLEKFFTNGFFSIINSTSNDGDYTIDAVQLSGSNTEVFAEEPVPGSVADGVFRFERAFRISSISGNAFLVPGDRTADLAALSTLRIFASKANDGVYTISSAVFNMTDTVIDVVETIPDAVNHHGYLSYVKTLPVIGVNQLQQSFLLAGNVIAEIDAPYKETRNNSDGTTTRLTIGGIAAPASITPITDPVTPSVPTGAYNVVFSAYTLPSHVDPEIDWYKGILRVPDTNPVTAEQRMKELQIWNIARDTSGNILSPLQLVAFDSTPFTDAAAGIYPIQTTGLVTVNFHPSYRLYLAADIDLPNNIDFSEGTTLPAQGAGSKITYMGIRAADTAFNNFSRIVPPVPLLAQEIVQPSPPEEPSGPDFATRPDFYGKSTYTFDVKLTDTASGRRPFALVFYRCDERKILDTLYVPSTVQAVLDDLELLRAAGDPFYYQRWRDLARAVTDGSDLFPLYGSYRFPVPDNSFYVVPNRDASILVQPFNGITPPGDPAVIPNTGGQSMKDVVKNAIDGAFIALTEQPLIYSFLKGGLQTSSKTPVFRNANGDLVPPVLPTEAAYDPNVYDPFPMAVQYAKGASGTVLFPGDPGYSSNSNDFFVRFTDYRLDGASTAIYFYFAVEMTNKLQVSDRSPVKGPVLLVNAAPAEQPGIRAITAQIADPALNQPAAVRFKLNPFNNSEGITRFGIFRAINAAEALSVRTMDFVNMVNVGDDLIDDFSNPGFALFGEALFYRIVAYRSILNEEGQEELIPSKPSELGLSNVIDVVNPQAPQLRSVNGTTTATQLLNVQLRWSPTAYNSTYVLQKQNAGGTWTELYRVKSNAAMQYPPLDTGGLPNFVNYPETAVLERFAEDGAPLFHRYRVMVINSSGLLNLVHKELILAKGDLDLQELPATVSYSDSTHVIDPLSSGDVDDGLSHPISATFTSLMSELPAGHNALTKIDIELSDDLGNTHTKTILPPATSVTFMHGDGNLQMDAGNPNRTYTISTFTYTDLSTAGVEHRYELRYVAGPCHSLLSLADILSFADGNGFVMSSVENAEIDEGFAQPDAMTFTDISAPSSLSPAQIFDHMEITVADNRGHSALKTITSAGGNVSFAHGDGDGLVFDNSDPNLVYTVTAVLYTNLCTQGTSYTYELKYVYTPAVELSKETQVAALSDANGETRSPLTSGDVNNGFNHPGGFTITDLVSSHLLPGDTFVEMQVTVGDTISGLSTKIISTPGGSVSFAHGDGGLTLDPSNPNQAYGITLRVITDLVPQGVEFSYILTYTYDPYVELAAETSIITFTDQNGFTQNPMSGGVAPHDHPGNMTFADLASGHLPAGDVYDKTTITVEDNSGGIYTQDILSASGSVTFVNGQGGLMLTAPERIYTVSANVFSLLCPDGVLFVYQIKYEN